MIALNILLGVLAFVCLLFIVGEPKPPISDRSADISRPPLSRSCS